MRRLLDWIADTIQHYLAKLLVKNQDWHLLFCPCGEGQKSP